MKPYHRIPILECGEPLVPIPSDLFVFEQPHPYEKLAAPYGEQSPYVLRKSVLSRLINAQVGLQTRFPGWKIQIFDAYRPIAVQEFMVEHAFQEAVAEQGIPVEKLTAEQRHSILSRVYQFWALPSSDPSTPPPHSTGAAIDVTLVDAEGKVVDMGSPIDELSPRSFPDYFVSDQSVEQGFSESDRVYFHQNRQRLQTIMLEAGFRQHPNEWWHFSLGDQMWAWLVNREKLETMLVAQYGAV